MTSAADDVSYICGTRRKGESFQMTISGACMISNIITKIDENDNLSFYIIKKNDISCFILPNI